MNNLTNSISEAYVRLLLDTEADLIQANDVIKETGITKDSFYSRFKSLTDVAEWTLYKKMKLAMMEANKARTPEEAVIILVKHVMLNKKLLQKMLKAKNYYNLEQNLYKIIKNFIERLIEKEKAYQNLDKKDLQMSIDFFSGGLTSYILHLCLEDEIDEAAVSNRISRLFRGDYLLFDKESKIINSKGEVEILHDEKETPVVNIDNTVEKDLYLDTLYNLSGNI